MADTITVRENTVGNPVQAQTVVHLDVVGSLATTPLYTPAKTTPAAGDNGPSQPSLTYHVLVDAPVGVDDAVSPSFTPSSDFKWTWDGYVFPAAGSYSIKLIEEAGGTTIITQAATVD